MRAQDYWNVIAPDKDNVVSEEMMNDASFVMLRELTFNYQLPANIVSKTPFRNIRAGVYGRNLFYFQRNTDGYAPEAAGMYVRPEIDPYIGKVPPNIEAIAQAIAKRDGARIVPTGVYALNRLGLSTQVPMNIIYLTDGSARKVNIDNRNIVFKRVSPKNVATVGEISGLVIQALRTIGKENVREDEIIKIQELLKKEKPTRLSHDIRLAPSWIRAIMQPILKQPINE